jgi:hypothetical protein
MPTLPAPIYDPKNLFRVNQNIKPVAAAEARPAPSRQGAQADARPQA